MIGSVNPTRELRKLIDLWWSSVNSGATDQPLLCGGVVCCCLSGRWCCCGSRAVAVALLLDLLLKTGEELVLLHYSGVVR